MSANELVPVTVLGGFLGAGKTTLLNRILNGETGRRFAVLVNDFGAINIDARLITEVRGETVSLANGCVCCTIRDDLAKAVVQVLDAPSRPDWVVIETSGVSEPAAVAMTLAVHPALALRTRIDAIITVVDAEQLLGLSGDQQALAQDQITAADLVVVNKTDRVDAQELARVRARLGAIAPETRQFSTHHADVPLSILFGIDRSQLIAPPGHHHAQHDHRFSSFSWCCDAPLAFAAVYEAFRTLPNGIYRGKGIVSLAEVPDKRVIVQMVGRRVTIERGARWGEETPDSQIALIGAGDAMDAPALRARFEACRTSVAASAPSRMAAAVIEVLRRG